MPPQGGPADSSSSRGSSSSSGSGSGSGSSSKAASFVCVCSFFPTENVTLSHASYRRAGLSNKKRERTKEKPTN